MKKRHLVIAVLLLFVFYVGSYTLLYMNRHPAGNLAYFVYLKNDAPDAEEYALYYFYYPIYKLHLRLGGGKHNWDRYRGVVTKDFNG
ncbi:MAG TPA: hypothetical protein VMV72_19305 [Verrucomicrobiae bacterium]|nr:hypothetical protein [Verrucomicrobiae bacterium]